MFVDADPDDSDDDAVALPAGRGSDRPPAAPTPRRSATRRSPPTSCSAPLATRGTPTAPRRLERRVCRGAGRRVRPDRDHLRRRRQRPDTRRAVRAGRPQADHRLWWDATCCPLDRAVHPGRDRDHRRRRRPPGAAGRRRVAGRLAVGTDGPGQFTPTRPASVRACRTFRADVDPVVEAAYEASLDAIAADGIPVERVDSLRRPGDHRLVLHLVLRARPQPGRGTRPLGELRHLTCRTSCGSASACRWRDYLAATRRRHELGARIDDTLGGDSVLALPTLNVQDWGPEGPAATDAGSVTGDPSIAANTPDINLTGHPAANVPMGLGDRGVPMGLQLVAPRWSDGWRSAWPRCWSASRPWR